jgi:hypothetical protein
MNNLDRTFSVCIEKTNKTNTTTCQNSHSNIGSIINTNDLLTDGHSGVIFNTGTHSVSFSNITQKNENSPHDKQRKSNGGNAKRRLEFDDIHCRLFCNIVVSLCVVIYC